MDKLFSLINEVVEQWIDDEPSLADRYYEKKLGIQSHAPKIEPPSGELIGYLSKKWGVTLTTPVPVYKNPKNLNGFDNDARGVLTDNGDIYVAQTSEGLHLNIIELLAKEGIIPTSSFVYNYTQVMPEEYITIVRKGNRFLQSDGYEEFPMYYESMFELANEVQPYQFVVTPFY